MEGGEEGRSMNEELEMVMRNEEGKKTKEKADRSQQESREVEEEGVGKDRGQDDGSN